MASVIQVLIPTFNPPPTAENAGARPSRKGKRPDPKKADDALKERLEQATS